MEKRLAQLPPGTPLVILATDPMARVDIPLYCRQNGHQCDVSADGEVIRFSLVKAG